MNDFEINEHLKNYYLTAGVTRDNFVATACPTQFLLEAETLLHKDANNTKSIVIKITQDMEQKLIKTLNACNSDYERKLLARDYFCTLFAIKINGPTDMLKYCFNLLSSGNAELAKSCHADCPMPYEIDNKLKNIGNAEINIFLIDTTNEFLQQAINTFISSRSPYSIKVFTNNSRLPSYLDLLGTPIEAPHDYMNLNVNKFIEYNESQDD